MGVQGRATNDVTGRLIQITNLKPALHPLRAIIFASLRLPWFRHQSALSAYFSRGSPAGHFAINGKDR